MRAAVPFPQRKTRYWIKTRQVHTFVTPSPTMMALAGRSSAVITEVLKIENNKEEARKK